MYNSINAYPWFNVAKSTHLDYSETGSWGWRHYGHSIVTFTTVVLDTMLMAASNVNSSGDVGNEFHSNDAF